MSAANATGATTGVRQGGQPVTHSIPVSDLLDNATLGAGAQRKLLTIEASVDKPVMVEFKLATIVPWAGTTNTISVGNAALGAQLVAAVVPSPNTANSVTADLVSLVTYLTARTPIYFSHVATGAPAGSGILFVKVHPVHLETPLG